MLQLSLVCERPWPTLHYLTYTNLPDYILYNILSPNLMLPDITYSPEMFLRDYQIIIASFNL